MENTNNISIKRPSWYYYISEPFRALGERINVISFLKKYKSKKSGDGHPVMVVPGFMGNDKSVKLLTKFLKKNGYNAQSWGLGMNLGNLSDLKLLSDKIEKMYQESGRKVSVIGWSLGGVYVRQIAKMRPDMIRQVVTLCSPFAGLDEPNNAAWLYTLVHGGTKISDLDPTWLKDIPAPASVPTTAIYSKSDGVVPWQVCIEETEDRIHQNIQVVTSHLGVVYNKKVLPIIIDRLQYEENNWVKYEAGSF